ncbi:MAG TPA: glycoside hydrolase family 78 protein [Candidatus Methylacidiphilales bacterium]|jgi:alpha-L-rhamnosidase|nr:glycoside hydrolase family 78 protein [Candidatus Methylacidiphilales bacterium]
MELSFAFNRALRPGLLTAFCWLAAGFLAYADDAAASVLTAGNLRCEYLHDPLGLDVLQPRLDWTLAAPDDAPRNLGQKSYRVLVASSPDKLAQDQGDLWDSGDVTSTDTAQIVYGGKPLISREGCYWKVRVTDSKGNPGEWSKPAMWEMGLLQPDDWQAKWIDGARIGLKDRAAHTLTIVKATYSAIDGKGEKDVTDLLAGMVKNNALEVKVDNDTLGGDPAHNHQKQLHAIYMVDGQQKEATEVENFTLMLPGGDRSIPYLRKDFTLKPAVVKARLYATALGLYELHLNGQRVGDHLFAPDWTDYNKRVRYQAYDVTALVHPGANTLGGLVGNGWYCGHIGNGGFQAWGTMPALMAQLEVTYSDGSVDRIVTDASWKEHAGPILSADNMLGENDDAQREIAGWDEPGLDTTTWTAVSERTESARELDGQDDEPVRETAELKPKSINQPKPGQYVFDLGQNMVGFVRLKVSAPAGTKLTLRHAEMLNSDGTMYTANLRGAPAIDTYVCKGGGEETWQPHFTFHGFRYVELTGLPQAPTTDSVTGIVIGSVVPDAGHFSCTNAQINQLQSNIQWGMRGNYLSVPTDCPQRDERMGWMGDAQIFIRTATYNGDVAAFFTKWMVDVDDEQTEAGVYTDVCPHPPQNDYGASQRGGVPAWGDAGVVIPWTIYLVYGDTRILRQHLPAMTRWVEWCRAQSTNLIRDHDRGSDYGDWLAQHEDTSKELIGTAFFAHSADLLAKSYAAVGDSANAAKYQDLFEQIRTAFDQRYVGADGEIKGGTQTAYSLALRFNLLPDNQRTAAGDALEQDVVSHQDHLTTGFVGVSHLLPALTMENKIGAAYRLLLQDSFPSWLFSVKHGATTVWERWDGWTPEKGFQNPGMNSFNHYSLGSCGEWMFDTVAGIDVDPAAPGFRHIIIRPRPGPGLTSAGAAYDSIRGKIATKWSVDGKAFTLDVTVPLNTTATVVLPTTDAASVSEGGQPVAGNADIPRAVDSTEPSAFTVGSGKYHFTCALAPSGM